MKPLFYIGLSLMSSPHTQTIAEQREKRSAEGLRIVSLLDAAAMPVASPGGGAISNKIIAREPGGRPYFVDSGKPGCFTDFNISHSRNMVAATLQMSSEQLAMSNEKPCRTGCDVQHVDTRKSCVELSRRFFHAGEQAYIEEDPAAQVRNFYRIWVLKEAWLKLHGLSVFNMAKTPDFSIGSIPQTSEDKSGLVFFLYELSSPVLSDAESYMLAAARYSSLDGEAEPEIRWFSDITLTLNKVENIYAAQSPENTVMPNIRGQV